MTTNDAPPAGFTNHHQITHCPSCRVKIGTVAEGTGAIEWHKGLGWACWTCRDTADVSAKVLELLAGAFGCQMNQRTMARRMGRTALSLSRAITSLSRLQLIERAYTNPNLEAPSATTYKLTVPGKIATGVQS